MVLVSQRDGLGSADQAPRDQTSGTRGTTDVPAVGQRGGAQGPRPGRTSVPEWGLSAWCNNYLAPRLGRVHVRRYCILEPGPAACWRMKRGTRVSRLSLMHCHPRPLGYRNKTKREQKTLHPSLLWGKERCGHQLLKSRIQSLRFAHLRGAACPTAFQAWQG